MRYWGEPAAAVAAEDEATARAALELIEVEYRRLPAYFEPKARSKAGTHAGARRQSQHRARGRDVLRRARQWLAAASRKEAHHYAEVTHAQMEPDAALADYDAERGTLTLQSVTQVPYHAPPLA